MAVCEGVCELDRGGGGSGDITLFVSDANGSLSSDCFWDADPWESIGKVGLDLETGGGVE